jgi:hypothetical protein
MLCSVAVQAGLKAREPRQLLLVDEPREWQPNITLHRDGDSAPELRVVLKISDAKVREKIDPDFDGLEWVFALVPVGPGDEWTRVAMTHQPERSQTGIVDVYEGRLADSDVAAIAQRGIALALDTNVGTIWLQRRNENWRPVQKLEEPR